jgi:cob(I)alamin adenosyltransferase
MRRLVHIYTGDGKGKTTAALGLTMRFLGHNFNVCFITFLKDPEKYGYGEFNILKKLKNVVLYHFAKKCPYFEKNCSIEEIKKEVKEAVEFIKTEVFTKNFILIVLDEILVCVREKILDVNELINLIKLKPQSTELVLTGQANKNIIEKLKSYVDYISEVKKLKHPYDKGIKRRKGVEY